MEFAVYIAVPTGDDCDRIAQCACDAAPEEFDFSIREKSDPSEASDAELCFRVCGVSHSQEAVSRALQIYQLGRRRAGLKPDDMAQASLAG